MTRHTSTPPSPWTFVLIGLSALAIAMGIGRFAFTPLMPLMLRDGSLDAVTGAEWAAANYLGYLVGALTAARFGHRPRLGLQIGLMGVALATFAMVWSHGSHPWLGAALRGSAGVFSAWVLVCASSWCLPELARRESSSLSGWMYTGVGLGIAATGLMTWLGGTQTAQMLWIELGILAVAGTCALLRSLPASTVSTSTPQAPHTAAHPPGTASTTTPRAKPVATHASNGNLGLVLCYSAFGFGYIIPATFLPTMARQLVSDPLVFGLTWPIFGTAAALSVAFASRWLSGWPRQKVWAMAQALMAVGTLLPLLQTSLWVLAASAVLVGGTFMVTTMAGLQLARERMPENPTHLQARLTAGFATGQIAGPVLVRLLGSTELVGWDALHWANAAATLLLAVTAMWLWRK